MRNLTFLPVLLLPALAQACPSQADLSTGFTIEFDDGASEYYVSLRDDLVRMEQSYEGETTAQMDLGLGVFVLSYMDVYDGQPDLGSRITTAYPDGMASLRVPEAGARWSEETTGLNSGLPFSETINVAWGQPMDIQIGTCGYTAMDGIIAYQSDYTYSEGLVYLPDLGIGFVAWYEEDGSRYNYGAVGIRAGR